MANVVMRLNVALNPAVLADLATYWTSLVQGIAGTLAVALDGAMTSVTITPTAGITVAAGSSILIDQEPMLVTAVAANVLTVTRSPGAAILAPAAPHLVGATVSILTYPDMFAMITRLAIKPWIAATTQQLGANSQTYASASTGSLASY